ncbi:PIR Superfamily Protein [Plasmodium ovale curtisi]|uniref:PIR Superfamily Protein n=1 Tax=Plasmodium ovale curtisi TaxID=864141 RepID=A0A1A8WFB1_PLAOA|nr:PIR Superfamily Protein [Plasmodium ovale curtisi]
MVVIPDKQKIFAEFEKSSFSNDQDTLSFLKDLNEHYNDLYNYGCLFEKAHKYAQTLHSIDNNNYICGYFNEWVNKKNQEHTSNGKNCQYAELWEQYIEKLWIQLLQKADTPNWCTRTKLRTLKRRFHKFLNKNERIRNNIYKYVPQKLLDYSENMDTHQIDETINLSYLSSHNS